MKQFHSSWIQVFQLKKQHLCRRISQLIDGEGGRISHLDKHKIQTDKTQAKLEHGSLNPLLLFSLLKIKFIRLRNQIFL